MRESPLYRRDGRRLTQSRSPAAAMSNGNETCGPASSTENVSDEINENKTTVYSSLRTVFVCGFIGKRWHNNSLMAIISDLLPSYYICSNPPHASQWSRQRSMQMLSTAEALIFFINEFTLKDDRCLLTLQYAWDLMIPMIMLRHPRTKLVISASIDRYGRANPLLRERVVSAGEKPDLILLQDVLYHGYRNSIAYDRLNHESSMRQIKQRLRSITLIASEKEREGGMSRVPSTNGIYMAQLKLPPITSPTSRSGGTQFLLSPEPSRVQHSHSMVDLTIDRSPQPTRKTPHRKSKKKSRHASANREDSSSPPTDHSSTSATNGRTIAHYKADRPRTADSRHTGRRYSTTSLDDYTLYQNTQYLVFSVKDKTQKPTLIRFPEDIIQRQQESRLESVWGSDTSLEEEAERALAIRGGFDLPLSRDSSPAPYIDPL
uniref:Uncharacterized protein n=1 Tax=Plectus sambesii TaxID=2011161 RepID=A0A914UM78_9BILA